METTSGAEDMAQWIFKACDRSATSLCTGTSDVCLELVPVCNLVRLTSSATYSDFDCTCEFA